MGMQTLLYFFLFFFLFRLCLYHTFAGSLNFLIGQFQLSADNSEAVAYYQVNNWWWLSISIISFLMIPFFSKDASPRFVFLIMILPFFAAWKHAMARADGAHVGGYLNLLLIFTFLLWLVSDVKKTAGIILCLISLSAYTLNMAVTSDANDFAKQKDLGLFKPYNLYNLVVNFDSISATKTRYSRDVNASEKLPDTLLKLIGKKTVDVYPWNYSIIAANKLNWIPRPSLHSYASYTHWLDMQNADHILSGKSSQYLIWHIQDADGKLSSIDYRYLLNDAPETTLAFFSHYFLIFKNEKFMAFKKLLKAVPLTKKNLSRTLTQHYDTWINVPACGVNSILRAKVKIKKSAIGSLKSVLYKGEAFSIFYETSDKKIVSHKIVPKNAEDGLWINPLILQPRTNYTEPLVKRIKLVCWNKDMVTPDFKLEFEEVKFPLDHNFLNYCFNKSDTLHSD